MQPMSKDNPTPLYLQIANNIRTKINDGEIVDDEALPSERELTAMTGASRVTIRKAIDKLIAEGLLYRKQGSGTYVSPRIQSPSSFLSSFTDDAIKRGDEPGVFWIVKSFSNPTADEAAQLEIAVTSEVARLGRVRLSNGEPLAIENAIVPKEFLPELDTLGDSLYEALSKLGHRPIRGRQKIRASLATPTEAGLLQIDEGSEVLRIERTTYSASGSVVEYTRSAYRGDRYEFVSDLS
ncbi:GntR family transcriptional regulator [Hyphococcus sp. DH-69]|uniref:GntR family transcriptional regulator n=1 Tax=Hyphococcus formosus TaxID=3143534 RepID=UPI00398AB9ED